MSNCIPHVRIKNPQIQSRLPTRSPQQRRANTPPIQSRCARSRAAVRSVRSTGVLVDRRHVFAQPRGRAADVAGQAAVPARGAAARGLGLGRRCRCRGVGLERVLHRRGRRRVPRVPRGKRAAHATRRQAFPRFVLQGSTTPRAPRALQKRPPMIEQTAPPPQPALRRKRSTPPTDARSIPVAAIRRFRADDRGREHAARDHAGRRRQARQAAVETHAPTVKTKTTPFASSSRSSIFEGRTRPRVRPRAHPLDPTAEGRRDSAAAAAEPGTGGVPRGTSAGAVGNPQLAECSSSRERVMAGFGTCTTPTSTDDEADGDVQFMALRPAGPARGTRRRPQ